MSQSYLPSASWVYVSQKLSWDPLQIPSPVIGVAGYLLALWVLPRFFKKPVDAERLRIWLAAHNFLLLLASMLMFFGTLLEVYWRIEAGASFFDLYCDPKWRHGTGRLMYWVFFFHVSKYYELLDTLFIIMKSVSDSHPNILNKKNSQPSRKR